jgi:hypothetical protein
LPMAMFEYRSLSDRSSWKSSSKGLCWEDTYLTTEERPPIRHGGESAQRVPALAVAAPLSRSYR